MSIKIEHLNWTRTLSQWELKREPRIIVEEKYRTYTGDVDVFETHIPYTHTGYLEKAIKRKRDNNRNRIMVLDADSLNLDLFSRFHMKSTDRSKPSDEIQKLMNVLKMGQDYYDNIVYISGNHENRLKDVIYNHIQDKEIAEEIIKGMPPLPSLFKDQKIKIDYVDNYFIMIGDTVICHMEKNSGVPGSISRDLISYFVPRINKQIGGIVQAHTHNQSWLPVDRVIFIECGAMIPPLDYWRDGHIKGVRKMSSMGYGDIKLNNGKIDPDLSRPRFLEWEGYL